MKRAAALVLLLLVAACSGGTGSGGTADCADLVRYGGHRYVGYGELQRMPATTGPAGTATRLSCDDGRGPSPEEEIDVAKLRDVPLDRGFLSHGQLHVRDDLDVPAAAAPWFGPDDVEQSLWTGGEVTAQVRCDDGRFLATGLVAR